MDNLADVPLGLQDLVEVSVPEEENSPYYPSRVEDIEGEQLILGWPTNRGMRIALRKEQVIAVCFTRQEAVFHVSAVVTELLPNGIPRIMVRPFGATRRIQRREYYRVRALVPVQLAGVIRTPNVEGPGKPIRILSHTIDISGSGFAVHQSFAIPSGTIFETRICLDKDQPAIKLEARVVHSDPLAAFRGRQVYRIALTYVSITEQQRQAIVRHVFAVQRDTLAG
jgi:c-di-GMP-binding flagellar brake protein YcgR